MHGHSRPDSPPKRFLTSPLGLLLLAAIGVAVSILVYDHRMHVFSGDGLLVALLVACVGSHFFMHGRHGGHGGHGSRRRDGRE